MKKIIFVMLAAALIAPMFIKGPDGKPIMTLSDWIPEKPEIGGLSESDEGSSQEFYRFDS